MCSINYKAVTEHKRAYKECLANYHIITLTQGMSAILNNQIQRVSETRLSTLAMTSVLSHWLTTKPFVLPLYKCDTTRMVGRLINSTAIYISLSISPITISPGYINKYSFSNIPHNIPTISLTPCISLIAYIYLHILHLINPLQIPTQPTSH